MTDRHNAADPAADSGGAKKNRAAEYFTANRIAYVAVFTALAYALRFLEFPLIPAVDFLKMDFSNIFPLIGGYALGPVAGVTIGVLKEALWIFYSKTMGVGELANVLVMLPYVLLPAIAYKYRKGIKSVAVFLAAGSILQVAWSFPVNMFLNFPVFLGFRWPEGMQFFLGVWYWVILFNFVKVVLLDAVVLLIYKPISNLIKFTGKKFAARRRA